MAAGFAVYYSLRGLSYLYNFPAEVATLLGWPALASAAYAAVLLFWVRGKTTSLAWVEGAIFSLGLLLIFNVFWNFYLTMLPIQLVLASFVLIAIGLGTSALRAWFAQVFFCVIPYLYSVSMLELDSWVPYLTILAVGVLLSYVAFAARAPMMRERILLQLALQEKAEKLQIANEAKDRFVANMSHELRTPLTGVMGMMELLESTNLDEEQRFMLQNAQKSSEYLLHVITDILDFAKLESGEFELRLTNIDLLDLCRTVVSVFEASAKSKGLELRLFMPDRDRLLVKADGARIGQILMNFISNAIKFTDRGQIEIQLEWIPAQSGGYAVFSVTDKGKGIPNEEKETLFNRFEQADTSINRTTPGTGLGLSISKDLVTLMGGAIGVTSEVGKGSCFSFQLALEDGDNAEFESKEQGRDLLSELAVGYATNTNEAADGERSNTLVCPQKQRALLAEDNPINQLLIVRMLEFEGLNVTLVKNGEQAVDAVDRATVPFDIVFMDVQMPVLDGVNATRIIRLRMAKPPPIVAITANIGGRDVAEYREVGMVAVLGKPLKQQQLRDVIQQVLGNENHSVSL